MIVRHCWLIDTSYTSTEQHSMLPWLAICAHVNELLIRNESESQGGSLTDRVEELLRGAVATWLYVLVQNWLHFLAVHCSLESARRAEEVFDGILKCKGRADATRNALNILQSHKVLFNLPRSIEKNIRAVRTSDRSHSQNPTLVYINIHRSYTSHSCDSTFSTVTSCWCMFPLPIFGSSYHRNNPLLVQPLS